MRHLAKRIIRDLIYLLFLLATRILPLIGFRGARLFGRGVGALVFRLFSYERKLARYQFDHAFPELPKDQREAILDNSFRHLGEAAVELLFGEEIIGRNVIAIEGMEELAQAYAQKRGVIVATGHFGNWELMAAAMAKRGYPVTVIARRIYDPRLDAWMRSWRERWGIKTILRDDPRALVKILRALKRGDLLGILFDLDTQVESETVPFFGIPARTPIAPVKLALRGTPLFFAVSKRVAPGIHRIRFTPIVLTGLHQGLLNLNLLLEEEIRRTPEQWIWFQPRFGRRKKIPSRDIERQGGLEP